jgi:hypothetical protein
MKPLFILLAFIGSFFAKSSQATDAISPRVVKSFQQTFTNAKEVVWTVSPNFHKVDFVLNNQAVTAFYNEQGNLTAITRNISSLQLPIILQAEIKKDYSDYWISELFELSNDNGTEYYLTIEDANSKVVLKSLGYTSWTTYSKTRK